MSTNAINGVSQEYEKPLDTMDSIEVAVTSPEEVQQLYDNVSQEDNSTTEDGQQGKEPAISTIESAISGINSRITGTRCAYNYDEETNRVTIKVYDKETDELIREVPPEKSLEVLKKVWEIAGIIVDEKR